MAYEQKPNTGALFKNSRKEKDTHPDYTGNLNIGGTEWRLSAWLKKDKSGNPYMSLSVSEPYQKEQRPAKPARQDDDDMVPF